VHRATPGDDRTVAPRRYEGDVGDGTVHAAYAVDMLLPRPLFRAFWALHKGIDRLSGGRIGTTRASGGRLGTLFLGATGRTSGQPRRNGLYYVEDGPNLVVVASNAGADVDPGWWRNLQAQPDADVEIAGEHRAVRARAATPDEQARLWPRFVRASGAFAEYQAKVTRRLPVVILEPR
jgi:F420H(2)-dependent quinone reductase